MQTSLIVTTYNWPQALALVLRSIAMQSLQPDEVIVADDGSQDSTRSVVDKFKAVSLTPVRHVWQEDLGFRVARVRNLGAAHARGDYLIFVDGDMVLHKDFVRSHLHHQRRNAFLHGPRVLLSDALASDLLNEKRPIKFGVMQRGITNRLNMLHHLPLSTIFSRSSSSWQSRACNLSIFKEDFAKVNGFNEDFEGWGKEDSELAFRLLKAGIHKVNLRLCGVAYHLGHAQSNEKTHLEDLRRNEALLNSIVATGSWWCENGLNSHTPAPLLDDRKHQQ